MKINLDNTNNSSKEITFNKTDEGEGELLLNIPVDDLKRKRIEKLDKAHRDMINKK